MITNFVFSIVTAIVSILNITYAKVKENVSFMAKLGILIFCISGRDMISLNETETKALYIINKRSKEIRDQKKLLREKVKKILFENDDIGITPDDISFF